MAAVDGVVFADVLVELSHQVVLTIDVAADSTPSNVVATKLHQDPAVNAVTNQPITVLGGLTIRSSTYRVGEWASPLTTK